jgi:hypothetical protein
MKAYEAHDGASRRQYSQNCASPVTRKKDAEPSTHA